MNFKILRADCWNPCSEVEAMEAVRAIAVFGWLLKKREKVHPPKKHGNMPV